MCGEKAGFIAYNVASLGSPPHVRGKANIRINTASEVRITPACAGKRFHWCIAQHRYWDHPRMCGEKTKKIP